MNGIREFIERLSNASPMVGQIVNVDIEVNKDWEIAGIMRYITKLLL